MKKLLMILILFSSCSNGRGLIKNRKNPLVLNEAYSQYVIGGKESDDGTHSSNNYVFEFNEIEDLEITGVWIDKTAYKFESFYYEGKFYVSAKVYNNNTSNVVDMKMPFTSKARAIIMYRKNDKNHYLEVEEITEKSSVNAD